MMLRAVLLLVPLLLAAPGAAQTGVPAPAQEAVLPWAQPRGPMDRLIAARERLGLTDEQVSRIQRIQAELRRRNEPLVRQLLEIRARTRPGVPPHERPPEEQEALRAAIQEARPLMQRIRANNRGAMARVARVLTPTQRRLLREELRGAELRPAPPPDLRPGRPPSPPGPP
jgi:Spy/CpxP family protein refolding chaperone